MKKSRKALTVLLISVLMLSGASMAVSALPDEPGETRGTYNEVGDETQSFTNAKVMTDGDTYYGDVNRVSDRADYFKIDAVHGEVLNVHLYIRGYYFDDNDGVPPDESIPWRDRWVWPGDPPYPPPAMRETCILGVYLYTGLSFEERQQPIDGAFNFFRTRHYVLNICCPVPGTNTYYINVSIDWFMTPNPFNWTYLIEFDKSTVPVANSGQTYRDTIEMEYRDTHWFKIQAKDEDEVEGYFETTNFNVNNPLERDINIWIFPDDLGGYPFSYPWDWSAAPNEPKEPLSVLSTYDGWYYIKLRAMNHTNSLPCSYELMFKATPIPVFPEAGVQHQYFDRFEHDTDWYKFTMDANQKYTGRAGYYNDVYLFNMTEQADAEDLPDFDLYLFGRVPDGRWLDLLDSSFRNDHKNFLDPNRDPNKNTEEVRGAAFYNGTYYLEVNAWNNTGYYDVRWEKSSWDIDTPDPRRSDLDNLPENAKVARAGVWDSTIHQAFDHYDWYKVTAREYIRVQLDTFKTGDLFNASVLKYNPGTDEYVVIGGGWNTWFNFTTREDHLSNLVDFSIDLTKFGGEGEYYISVFAAVAAQMASDPDTGRAFIYKTEDDAEANYELRLWVDKAPPFNEPPKWSAIPDLVVDEDENKFDYIDLDDYCIDYDVGDENLEYKVSVKQGKLKSYVLDKQSWTLGFMAFPDYSGKVVLTITAIDRKYLQASTTWNITFTSVNDPPRPLYSTDEPYVFEMPEDSVRMLDLKLLVRDVDKGDEINITFVESENLDIEIDPDTFIATFTGKPNYFGNETVLFVATDLENAETELPVSVVVENQEDPPLLLKPIGERRIDEDTSYTLPLTEYFWDPDGDDMFFTLSANLNVNYDVDPETYIMTLTPDPDWFGFRDIVVTARDSTSRVMQERFTFIVDPLNDPPEINSWSPPNLEHTMNEDTSQSFVLLNVTDPEFSVLIYQWYLDNKLVGPSNYFNYRPDFEAQGPHELKVVVTDEGISESDPAKSAELIWTIFVTDVPRPPEGGIASPANNAKFTTSDKVSFVALYYDLDGDEITYEWFVDNKAQSTQSTFDKQLSAGKHEVKLMVHSGEFTINQYVNISVAEAESPGFEAPLVFAGLAVTFVAAAAWRRLRLR